MKERCKVQGRRCKARDQDGRGNEEVAGVKVVGIVGYKKSGKTTLGVRLARELAKSGQRVGVVKHSHHPLDHPDTDTSRYREHAHAVAAISPEEVEIIIRGEVGVADLLRQMDADIVLVEGFKGEKAYPKIVCLREEGERGELCDEMTLCTASLGKGVSDYDILNDAHVEEMAEMALQKVPHF
jgi:molybdopterin-guanine dinucleotide biosynthesis protein B